MNYIKHLTGFFERVVRDDGLNSSHISLYVALFQHWNMNRFQNPISIARDDVMQVSKISGKATYHKCMRDLHARGYIKYVPSYNPLKGSLVFMLSFEGLRGSEGAPLNPPKDDPLNPPKGGLEGTSLDSPEGEPALQQAGVTEEMASGSQRNSLNKIGTAIDMSTGTGTEQVLVPSINNINITKLKNNESYRSENSGRQDSGDKNSGSNERRRQETDYARTEDAQANNKRDTVQPRAEKKKDIPPEISQVIEFFEREKYPTLEAHRFFNHFQSNGWRVGGKAPMKDWNAAARNWMLNYERFNRPVRYKVNLRASGGKNYGEPL